LEFCIFVSQSFATKSYDPEAIIIIMNICKLQISSTSDVVNEHLGNVFTALCSTIYLLKFFLAMKPFYCL